MDRVKPIVIRDNEKGVEYTLQFDFASAKFTNNQGFKISEMSDNIEVMLPILFYGAFRMHHKDVARNKTDALLQEISPVSQDFVIRLLELYSEPRSVLVSDEPVERKNSNLTVEL